MATAIDDPDAPFQSWRVRRLVTPAAPEGLMLAQGLMVEGDHVAGLAIREPGDHAGFAVRIPCASLARGDLSAFELWDGDWTPLARASLREPVLADAGPESSLHFDRRCGCYVHVRSLGFGASTLAAATATRLTGPWSSPSPFWRPPESDRPQGFVYAGKAHPELTGADLVVTYAANSFDFAAVVRDDTLYYPRFVRAWWRR